jgi:hypothetical protein
LKEKLSFIHTHITQSTRSYSHTLAYSSHTITTCAESFIHHTPLIIVMDRPVTRQKSMTFDSKAKVGALVQRARTFKKQKLAEEAEEESAEETLVLAHAVST